MLSTKERALALKKPWHFKVLLSGRRSYLGTGSWPKLGEWTERRMPIPCISGWHLTNQRDLYYWLDCAYGSSRRRTTTTTPLSRVYVYLAEGKGRRQISYDKACFAQARLLELVGSIGGRSPYRNTWAAALRLLANWRRRIEKKALEGKKKKGKRRKK